MEKQESFSPEHGFKVISEMINRTKRNISYMSFFFLVWGWLLFFAGISIFVLVNYSSFAQPYLIWLLVGIIGGVVTAIYGSRLEKKEKTISAIDKIFEYLWLAFAFTLLIFLIATVTNRIDPNPFVMMLTGLPTFVTGKALKFKPLIIGGILFWILGILTIYFFQEYSLLLFSLAILLGYIIPGHLLKNSTQSHV